MSTSLPTDLADRDIRQREIIPPDKLADLHCLVIGVGAIGRQVALQLAAIGVSAMDLVDDDKVGVENLAVQGYWPSDLDEPKVEATARLCRQIHAMTSVEVFPERFKRSSLKSLKLLADPAIRVAVFCCVDSIVARKLIWETLKPRVGFWVDARMSAEVVRVLASGRPLRESYYPTTLFGAEEAYAGSCTAKSTIYTANIAAGLMLSQFTKWLRGMPLEADVTLNLLSMELAVAGASSSIP